MSTPSRIGPYPIEREVGRGGMGVVYLGRDQRLGREVAIKMLPEVFSRDPDRVQRFEREARLLASLSHPNIAGIHGLEEQDGQRFLVLEYVPGETLAERIERGAIPVDEVAEICRQIAAALEAAHESGVIHRDLKPGNVKITPTGEVKVLDFGLAKGAAAASGVSVSDLSQSPTMALTATGAGVILGTAAYMSPEQARGKLLDRRTDIWSFGCVLYECLTGGRAFEGETVSDMIAMILQGKPDWSALPADTPPRVRALIERCLEKDAKKRLRDIGEAKLTLESPHDPISGVGTVPAVPATAKTRLLAAAWVVATVFGITTALLAWRLTTRTETQPITRLSVLPPPGVEIFRDPVHGSLSPDGRMLAFMGVDSLGPAIYLRKLDEMAPIKLAGAESGFLPAWSPDGRSIVFATQEKFKRLDLRGGAPLVLCDARSNGRGASWGDAGTIVFAAGGEGPLYKVPAGGGTPEPVTTLDSTETAHRFPEFLPGGTHFLYSALPPGPQGFSIYVGSTDGRTREHLMECDGVPRYVDSGHLVFTRNGRIMVQGFDPSRRQLQGPVLVLRDDTASTEWLGASRVIVSRKGPLAYMTGGLQNTELSWIDRGGHRTAISVPEGRYTEIDVTADGSRIAIVKEVTPVESDVWVIEPARGGSRRLTFGPGKVTLPQLSPGGSRVAYATSSSGRWELAVRPVSGGEETRLATPKATLVNATSWSPDGRLVVGYVLAEKSGWDIWVFPADGQGEPRPLIATPYDELNGKVSPDGRWLLYSSMESGTMEIYVTSFPAPGQRYKISSAGGNFPFWRGDGRQILYASSETGAPVVVDVTYDGGFRTGSAAPFVGSGDSLAGLKVIAGAFLPDFSRALVVTEAATGHSINPFTIVQSWRSALEPE